MSDRVKWLKDRHRGETVVLVANGPSLNKMDLSWLNHYTTIGMNKIYLGFKKFGFYPNYYVCVNDKVIAQSEEQIRALNCVKFLSDRAPGKRIGEDALTYLINADYRKERFSKDLSKGLREGGTVTYAALQIAYYLGFSKVIIIGMDHNFTFEGRPNESRVMSGADVNHFVENYFGYGQTWDNPDLEKSEASYMVANEVFSAKGSTIIDCTVGGMCKVFRKCTLSDFLSR